MPETALKGYRPLADEAGADRAHPVQPPSERRRPSGEPHIRIDSRRWEAAILIILALLVSRAVFPGNLAPAGLAFTLALALNGLDHVALYALGAIIGQATILPSLSTLALIPAYLFLLLLERRWATRPAWLVGSVCLLALAGRLAVSGSSLPLAGFYLLEALILAILALVLAQGIPALRRGPQAMASGSDRFFLALVPLGLAVLGLSGLTVMGVNLAAVAGTAMIMVFCHLGGPGFGAAAGLLLALLPGIGFGVWPLTGGLAVGGLFGGLSRRVGRPGVISGFCSGLAAALALPAFHWPGIVLPLGQAMIGAGIYLIMPNRYLQSLGQALPGETSLAAAKRSEQIRLRLLLAERVQNLAGIFAQLSEAFAAGDGEIGRRPDLYTLLDQVVSQHCRLCSGFEGCWRDNFYASYRELFELISLTEMHGGSRPEDLRGRLAVSCFQRKKLHEAVELALARFQAEPAPRRQALESRDFVAEQLQGVAGIMSGLVREMHQDVEFRLEVEERLKSSFNRLGLAVETLSVLDYGRDLLEVRITKHGCLSYSDCQYLICPMVGRILGHPFTLWDRQCSRRDRERCSFTLVPAANYQVKHAVARLAKDADACGDSFTAVQTKDGRMALILSDGMGTGPKAARDSRATVDLLARLIVSGLREDYTLGLINEVLMLRSPEERCATIDMALIDLFKGEAEIIKVGAAPSYIKRNREVAIIRATTPPAGILREIEVNREKHRLGIGDYLIMATDGVLAGKLGPEETEDWVERALARVDVAGPQSMVDFLARIAQSNMGKGLDDDVTVIAAQLLPAGAVY